MRTNSFDFERALKKMERLRKNNRSQEEIIDDLKSELATINELSLLTHAMRLIVELDCRKSSELYINVESPMKQALYLIDVYYSIADRDGIEDITEAKWDVISQLLDEMEMAYFKAVGFPNDGDVFHDERDEKLEVQLSSFLFYFSNGKLCYEEQTLDRLMRSCKPYDDVIRNQFGFGVDDAVKFVLHVRDLNNRKYTETIYKGSKYHYYSQHPEEWTKLVSGYIDKGIDPSDWANQPELKGAFDFLLINPGEICIHGKDEVENVDIDRDSLLNIIHFLLYDPQRAIDAGTVYYADKRLSEEMPLFKVGDRYICPITKFLIEALYYRLSAELQRKVSKYNERKGEVFETKVLDVFQRFFPSKTRFYSSYTIDRVCENDLLIKFGTTWIVVECKNCGFRAPFRDAERGYERIKTDFAKAVQYGYDQCKRIEDALCSGNAVDLYDAKHISKLLCHVAPQEIGDVWSVVVTDYNYGPIQTDLSKLLNKEPDDLYPLSIGIDDLETFLSLMKRLWKGVAPYRFVEYLDYRERYQEHVKCFDELELAGFYLCDRDQFKRYADVDSNVITTPEMGEIFDAYYRVGFGFPNELNYEDKRHRQLPAYSKTFVMDDLAELSQVYGVNAKDNH